MAVMLYKDFDPSKLSCCELSKNKAGGNQALLLYDGQKNNTRPMQTPKMYAPFGLSEFIPDNATAQTQTKYSLDLSFKGFREDQKISLFYNLMIALDNRMIDLGVEHSRSWFGKPMSREVVQELYRPLVKPSKNPDKFSDTIKFKIRNAREGPGMQIMAYDSKRQSMDMHSFQAGSQVQCIVEFTPVWFVSKQYGITLTLSQLEIVDAPVGKLQGYNFINEDNENENENVQMPMPMVEDDDSLSDPEVDGF
eukprot:466198-Prorocentrum_minimum.AAC.11